MLAGLLLPGPRSGTNAAIYYDPALDTVRVTEFPESWPCTPERLLAMDKRFGWNKVAHDPATATYTLNCNLIIGSHDGSETYFQIGSKEHPAETLVMNGNLYIAPYFLNAENVGKNWYEAPAKVNRLTLGCEKDPQVKAAIKFGGEPKGKKYGLTTGATIREKGKDPSGAGGQLMLYHSKITALNPRPDCRIASVRITGDAFICDNSEISWVEYGAVMGGGPGPTMRKHRIEDSIFANNGIALLGGGQAMRRCVFRDCDIAIVDQGALAMELTECVFENNRQNWQLRLPNKRQPKLVCVDGTFGAGKTADEYALATEPKAGELTPAFISKRHVVIRVTTAEGQAVTNAVVKIKAEQEGPCLQEDGNEFKTGPNGQTLGRDDEKLQDAVLLTEIIKTVTAVTNQPSVCEFSYTISARAGDKAAQVSGVKPDESWKTIPIVLK